MFYALEVVRPHSMCFIIMTNNKTLIQYFWHVATLGSLNEVESINTDGALHSVSK